MTYSHNHQSHEHTHEHGSECDCGCHHSRAEEVIENALIFSERGTVDLAQSVPAHEALSSIVEKIAKIAQSLSVDDVILGHVKGLFECTAGVATISITSVDTVQTVEHEKWVGDSSIDSFTLTVNILSLAHTDAPSNTWADILFRC